MTKCDFSIPKATIAWFQECQIRAAGIKDPILKLSVLQHLRNCIMKERDKVGKAERQNGAGGNETEQAANDLAWKFKTMGDWIHGQIVATNSNSPDITSEIWQNFFI